jgi:hypothetical protein
VSAALPCAGCYLGAAQLAALAFAKLTAKTDIHAQNEVARACAGWLCRGTATVPSDAGTPGRCESKRPVLGLRLAVLCV